jgi:hypothetical protein
MTIVRRSRKAAFSFVFILAACAGSAVILGQIHWAMRETLSQNAAEQAVVALVGSASKKNRD